MLDRHYTPSFLAAALIKAAAIRQPKTIADFAAGRGELLRHANNEWTDARVIANDVDAHAVRYLRRHRPHWTSTQCDFLQRTDRDQLREHMGRIDLVLLNPPFSCRGASFHCVSYHDLQLRCSTALAFVIESIPFVAPKGELIAVLPRGSVRSEKDQDSWGVIRTVFDVDLIDEFGRETFPGCAVSSVIVRMRRSSQQILRSIDGGRVQDVQGVSLRRGTKQVHRTLVSSRRSKSSLRFIHSTTLRNNRIDQPDWTKANSSIIKGPAVLLPRVGRPDARKIATLPSGESVVLSDCILAVCCDSDDYAAALMEALIEHRQVLYAAYGGTCAPYLTLSALRAVLSRLIANIAVPQARIIAKA